MRRRNRLNQPSFNLLSMLLKDAGGSRTHIEL